jgi:hypothetical protein
MNPISTHITPTKLDIYHPSFLKKGTGLCPRVVIITPPLLAKEGPGEVTMQHGNNHTTPQKLPTGEKWESDKNRNKTQQDSIHLSHKHSHPIMP